MVKLNEFLDIGKKKLVEQLISEDITIEWTRDILLQNKFIVSHHSRELSLAEFFDRFIWDNLTEEQQNKVVEALNLIIEEDLFKEKAWEDNYCFHLLDLAIVMHKKLPGKINISPFILWKEKKFPNLSPPDDPNRPLARRLREQIESTFEKKLN